jgi:hypothetical protein
MQAWTMFQHYMASKIEAAKNIWECCGPINNAVKAMSIPNLVAKPLSYMLKRWKRYGSHHSYVLSQVHCFTCSELTHQLLSISFHHQDMLVFENFRIYICHGGFGFSDEFKQELKCRDLCWEFLSYRNEVNRDFNEMGSK